ncbi:FecR family protein [Parapedobacter defluvii]|nr:FecR domain-containing protein [Parapedobacter defluvii]
MKSDYPYELFSRYLKRETTPAEETSLMVYFRDQENTGELQDLVVKALSDLQENEYEERALAQEALDRVKANLNHLLEQEGRRRAGRVRGIRRWLPYAAAIIFACTLGAWFLMKSGEKIDEPNVVGSNILPGGNRATLTWADGSTIDLSETQSGIVVGKEITYVDGSDVLHVEAGKPESQSRSSDAEWLTLSTPRGGTYQVILPDGSQVWLNASTTLKYPSQFTGPERVVELTGEAYFSVTHIRGKANQQMVPFRVLSNGQTVEVLGTEFNISAYPDDIDTRTTLVSGSVQIMNSASKITHTLRPGDQSITHQQQTEVIQVDPSLAVAWKSGDIVLTNVALETIMQQISRWYDVEVEYAAVQPRSAEFFGTVSRMRELSAVLQAMESTGNVRFQRNNRTIIVNPKN